MPFIRKFYSEAGFQPIQRINIIVSCHIIIRSESDPPTIQPFTQRFHILLCYNLLSPRNKNMTPIINILLYNESQKTIKKNNYYTEINKTLYNRCLSASNCKHRLIHTIYLKLVTSKLHLLSTSDLYQKLLFPDSYSN